MLYTLLIFIAILIAISFLRLRMRFLWGDNKRLLFVGLGQTGPEIDFVDNVGSLRIFGWHITSFQLNTKPKKQKQKQTDRRSGKIKQREERERDWYVLLPRIVPRTATALGRMIAHLYRYTIVEELSARIEAGFDSPDLTGQLYGGYHAVVGAVPGLSQRISFQPNWVEESFNGKIQMAFALPLYRLIWRIIVLIGQLPLRDLYKLAIGTKRGGQDVQ